MYIHIYVYTTRHATSYLRGYKRHVLMLIPKARGVTGPQVCEQVVYASVLNRTPSRRRHDWTDESNLLSRSGSEIVLAGEGVHFWGALVAVAAVGAVVRGNLLRATPAATAALLPSLLLLLSATTAAALTAADVLWRKEGVQDRTQWKFRPGRSLAAEKRAPGLTTCFGIETLGSPEPEHSVSLRRIKAGET